MKYFIHQEKYYVQMDEIFNPCAKNIINVDENFHLHDKNIL